MDCKMQVSAGQLPPCDPPPPPLPCPVVLGQEPPLGFPRGWILFYCWWSPGAPASGCLGLPWPGLLTASRVVPKTSWLVWRPAVALEVRLPDVPHSHLCPRAWHCAFFPEKTGHQRDWSGAHSQAF